MIKLMDNVHQQLYVSARMAYPAEACGLLVTPCVDGPQFPVTGPNPVEPKGAEAFGDSRITIVDFLPAENAAPPHLRNSRFQMEPRFILDAQRRCRERSREIAGVFHSHPDHIPVPSATDLREAWPIYLYLILHVRQDGFGSLMAWRLATQGGGFDPLQISASQALPPARI